ncbi:signal peptidase I [Arabiibacter massiliensis]|uniref:signal peptidase I n=1 Tax=Arabiibacter massiliensis TaxID=1870985 RepID=UPI0009BB2C00|nr:signal peptidase I [Arabiibacter massiliensis]
MDSGQHAVRQSPGILRTFVGLLVMVAFVFGLSWVLRTFVFQAYEIPSGSMEETIMTGDMVFAEKVSYYLRDPKPGDIVTFQDPEISGRILIKRCIAVGGQTVDINDEDGLVYVDGVPQDEPYTDGQPSYRLQSDVEYPYTVPEGYLWMMGDNRTNSQDSRFFGAIPISSVTGRGALVYWPLNDFSLLD